MGSQDTLPDVDEELSRLEEVSTRFCHVPDQPFSDQAAAQHFHWHARHDVNKQHA